MTLSQMAFSQVTIYLQKAASSLIVVRTTEHFTETRDCLDQLHLIDSRKACQSIIVIWFPHQSIIAIIGINQQTEINRPSNKTKLSKHLKRNTIYHH